MIKERVEQIKIFFLHFVQMQEKIIYYSIISGWTDFLILQNNFKINFGRSPFHDIAINSDYPSMAVIVFLFEAIKFSMQES